MAPLAPVIATLPDIDPRSDFPKRPVFNLSNEDRGGLKKFLLIKATTSSLEILEGNCPDHEVLDRQARYCLIVRRTSRQLASYYPVNSSATDSSPLLVYSDQVQIEVVRPADLKKMGSVFLTAYTPEESLWRPQGQSEIYKRLSDKDIFDALHAGEFDGKIR